MDRNMSCSGTASRYDIGLQSVAGVSNESSPVKTPRIQVSELDQKLEIGKSGFKSLLSQVNQVKYDFICVALGNFDLILYSLDPKAHV